MWHYEVMRSFGSQLTKLLRRSESKRDGLYCDYAAATPIAPSVAKKMDAIQRTVYGNPGSIHAAGVAARAVVDEARRTLARTLGVRPAEVYFTASGSEANNLAIAGLLRAHKAAGRSLSDCEVITTKLEHPSVLEVLHYYEPQGLKVHYAPVTGNGKLDLVALEKFFSHKTVLVTFAYASSEVGVVQDVKRITRTIRKYNTENQTAIKVHLDAAQAPLWLPCQLHQLGVDMLSLDAGKCNGPKGVGVLIKRADVTLNSVVLGGGQESGLRAGTENTAAIAGCALAIARAQEDYESRSRKVYLASQALVAALKEQAPEVVFNGPDFIDDVTKLERLPNNVHISLPGFDTEYAVIYLDKHGIAASTRSACSGIGEGSSLAVAAMTNDLPRADATIRFSLSPDIAPKDVTTIAATLRKYIDRQTPAMS